MTRRLRKDHLEFARQQLMKYEEEYAHSLLIPDIVRTALRNGNLGLYDIYVLMRQMFFEGWNSSQISFVEELGKIDKKKNV